MALSTITKKRFCHLRPLCVTLTNFSIYTKALSGSVGGGGVVVYQYTRKKFAKIPQNTQNSSKYTQNKFKENDIPNTRI